MKKLLANPLVVIGITLAFVLFWWSLYRTIQSFSVSRERLAQLRAEVDSATQEVQDLEQKLQAAQDPLTKEKIVRNELLQQKPGEYIVKIDGKPPKKNTVSQKKRGSPWEEWQTLLLK